jgi:phage protein D
MSVARSPRCQIIVNGEAVSPIECNVHLSIHQSADTFFAKLPVLPDLGLDEAFWADTVPIPIEIRGVNDINSASYSSLLIGTADKPQIAWHERTVQVTGRDSTAALTETKTSQLWRNLTDQQVITQLAQGAGLTVQFNGAPDSAGLQYDQDYSEIADSDSAWNIIVALARKAGCIAFVKGTTVYVQPIDAAAPNGMVPVNFQPPVPGAPASSNAMMLFTTRNLTLAKDTTVTLQSWQHKQGKTVTSTFNSKPKNAGSDRLIYQHRAANLTKAQQDKIATAHLKETLSHEREIDVSNFPGDVNVIPGLMGLTLTGTGTAFDQDYILSDAVHRFALDGGYMMDLTAHSQDASRGEPAQVQ